jgi:hypothetical protein
MGWYFRRSLGIGPFRVNLSKSGVGWSVGGRGFRVGRDARGRPTKHASIPGTGIGHRTVGRRGARGCLLAVAAGGLLLGGGLVLAAVSIGWMA